MSIIRRVLVVGGGTTGNSLTILLRRAGIDVDLVEIDPGWNVLGSGITLQGNALRALREIGVWEQVAANGFGFDTLGLTAPDGTVLHVQQDMRTGGPDLQATLGMQRPVLQRILTRSGSTSHQPALAHPSLTRGSATSTATAFPSWTSSRRAGSSSSPVKRRTTGVWRQGRWPPPRACRSTRSASATWPETDSRGARPLGSKDSRFKAAADSNL
jgi:hypothetical protein